MIETLVEAVRRRMNDSRPRWSQRGKAALAVAPLYWLAGRRAVSSLVRRRSYDLIHAHWIVPNALLAAPVARRLPFAIGLHGSDVFMAEKPLLRGLVGRALRRARLLTGCSPELVDRVLKSHGRTVEAQDAK